MSNSHSWPESEVVGVFNALGLKSQTQRPFEPKVEPTAKPPASRPVCLPRLSSNSNPPPTGKSPHADVERTTKRS